MNNVMDKNRSVFSYIREKVPKAFLCNAFPYIIICYFVLLLTAYVFKPIPVLYDFFGRQSVSLVIRLIASLAFVVYGFLVLVVYRIKLNKIYCFTSLGLVFLLVLSLLVSPRVYSSILNNGTYAYYTFVKYTIGIIDLLSGFSSCIIDLIFGLMFLLVLPYVASKESAKPFVYLIFVFVIFECFFSIIYDFNKYREVFSGNTKVSGYDINIAGSFNSKNQFGPFLIMGFCAGFLLLFWYKHKLVWKALISTGIILIGIISILSLCKTALVSMLVFCIPMLAYLYLYCKKRHKEKTYFIVLGIAIFALVILIILLNFFGNVPFLSLISKGFNVIFGDAFVKGLNTRFTAWAFSISTLGNYHAILGYPKGTLQYVLKIGTGGFVIYPHNGFIQQLLCFGIFGLFLLFFSFYLLFKRFSYIKEKSDKYLLISLFASILIFMFTETEIILLSASLLTFFFNISFSTLLNQNYKFRKELNYEIKI